MGEAAVRLYDDKGRDSSRTAGLKNGAFSPDELEGLFAADAREDRE